jgi:hypothetical protein
MINAQTRTLTTEEVAARFHELAQQEKWFDIQEEFFAEDVKSIDPPNSPFMGYAAGKEAVRQKGQDFVKGIEAVHSLYTGVPIVTAHHFAVVREKDLTVKEHGRIQIKQIMLYEVREGKIVCEQFFY